MLKDKLIATSVGIAGAFYAAGAVAQMEAATPAPITEPVTESASPELAAPAAAAEAPAATQTAQSGSHEIEEIVVTSRKRAESIQSVPLAVSAVSGDMLERANITDVNALATQVPSLVIVPGSSGSKAIPTFAIRGQSQQELSILADPSVPVYINDVVVERQQGVNASLFDIASVEVLKGPQGTLFGRNATGGAINIKANTPSKEYEGYVGSTVGNYGRFNSTAMINQPLTDWAQLRVAGQTTDSDGYLKDVVLDKMINHEHTKAARVSLALQPIDGLESLFTYSRFIEDDGGTGAIITELNPSSLANATLPNGNPNGTAAFLGYTGQYSGEQMLAAQRDRGIYKVASGADQYTRISTWDLANTTSYEINDGLSVKNIIGHREVTGGNYDDLDGMPIPFFQIARSYDFKQFSEEFQILGNTETLNWIVGLYYFEEEGGTDDYSITVKPINASPGNKVPQPHPDQFPGYSLTDPDGKNTSKSIFAQGTQKLNNVLEGLALTVGGRYTWDDREATIANRTGSSTDPVNGPQICRINQEGTTTPFPIDQCSFTNKKSFSEPTYNISLDYQFTPRNLVYLAHRRGYRTGGFGARASTPSVLARTYDAETVTDFEVGFKNDFHLGNMPLRFNLALYTADYKDIQRLLTDPNTLPIQTAPVNAGKATIQGGEAEFTFLPTDHLELSGFFSYTDASYDEFIDPQTGADLSKQPFARAPKKIYSTTARYTVPVASDLGNIAVQANYFHTDGYSTSDTYHPIQSVKGYGLVNTRADWKSVMQSNFDIGIFVNNLTDREYLTAFGDLYTSTSIGIVSRAPGEPRTYGFDIKYRFGAAGG